MVNPLDLTGRRILVTGASSGIGRATSLLLGELGAELVLVGRSEERLAETAAALNTRSWIEAVDLTTIEVARWMKDVAAKTGPLSGLVHAAGVHSARPLQVLKSDEITKVLDINVRVALELCKGLRQRTVLQSPASVVLVSSVMGLVGAPAASAYSASKGAVCALTRAVASELVREGVRVNCVAPGQVVTEMSDQMEAGMTAGQFEAIKALHPLGLGTPGDVASSIAFLLSNAARWITGTTLVVDGGYTMQ